MRRSRGTSPGFSLIEAIAAVALLALALPPLYGVFSGAIGRTSLVTDRADAIQRAESLLVEVQASFHGRFGREEGTDPNARWSTETAPVLDATLPVRETPDPARTIRLIPVRLAVSVRSDRGAQVDLQTMFLFREARR